MYFLYNFSSILGRPTQGGTVPSAHQKIDKVSLIDFIYKPGMDYSNLIFFYYPLNTMRYAREIHNVGDKGCIKVNWSKLNDSEG